MKAGKITTLSLLTALALIIFFVEAQLPPLTSVPGIKMGLSNIITLVALVMLTPKEAFCVLALRIVLGGFLSGNLGSVFYSAAGGLACFITMCILIKPFRMRQLWVVSIFGAIAHNCAQIAIAVLITSTLEVMWYLPILIVSAVVTGAFTGLCASFVIDRWRK